MQTHTPPEKIIEKVSLLHNFDWNSASAPMRFRYLHCICSMQKTYHLNVIAIIDLDFQYKGGGVTSANYAHAQQKWPRKTAKPGCF